MHVCEDAVKKLKAVSEAGAGKAPPPPPRLRPQEAALTRPFVLLPHPRWAGSP